MASGPRSSASPAAASRIERGGAGGVGCVALKQFPHIAMRNDRKFPAYLFFAKLAAE
jgi:hypothetical protein